MFQGFEELSKKCLHSIPEDGEGTIGTSLLSIIRKVEGFLPDLHLVLANCRYSETKIYKLGFPK